MTATELLAAARSIMRRDDAATAGVWPRASAFLARQALEESLDDVWRHQAGTAELTDCPMRTQLLCARAYLDVDLAGRIAWTWAALSRACHHHSYELAPTAAELQRWMNDVENLVRQVETSMSSEP